MSVWRATKAKRVYAGLLRLGWTLKKQVGSHRKLQRPGWPNFTFCFHDNEEVGPAALARVGKDQASVPKTFETTGAGDGVCATPAPTPYMMAVGGAGSSGLPQLARGTRIMMNANSASTTRPMRNGGSARIEGSLIS